MSPGNHSGGLFYLYGRSTHRSHDRFVLCFAHVAAFEEWFDRVNKKYPEAKLCRQGAQFLSWESGTYGRLPLKVEENSELNDLKSKWWYKQLPDADSTSQPTSIIPPQDAQGWMIASRASTHGSETSTGGTSGEYYPITGIKAGWGPTPGQVPLRQEVNEWARCNPKQRTLFLLALSAFQKIPVQERDSYFQIAGIHGMPNQPWDEPDTPQKDADDKGYCNHANVLFPTWHRPYLLLYEQRIYEIMISEIIPKYPQSERAAWRKEADSWRLPYWDWGSAGKVPDICEGDQIDVLAPPGAPSKIDNPMYKFRMPNNAEMKSAKVFDMRADFDKQGRWLPYGSCRATSRWPTKSQTNASNPDWVKGVVNNAAAGQKLRQADWLDNQGKGTIAEMVYRLLTYDLEYRDYSCVTQPNPGQRKPNLDINIEYIHNNIHFWAGGNGHMGQIPVATFDPIFWLHHCNIDRITAIWQTLNPNKWFGKDTKGRFPQETIGLPDMVDPDTPLRPFHKNTAGDVWTSNQVRDWFALGYSYRELQKWLPKYNHGGSFDEHAYRKDILACVNKLYGCVRHQCLRYRHGSSRVPRGVRSIDGGMKSNDFAVSCRFQKYAFQGNPFNIEIYLAPQNGTPPDPENDYVMDVYNFSAPARVNGEIVCSNCERNESWDVQSTAYIPITYILNKMAEDPNTLASVEKSDVEAYLKKNLYWRVTMFGERLGRAEMEKVQMEILVSTVGANYYEEPTQISGYDNFEEIPSLRGDGSGAFDESRKVPSGGPRPAPPAKDLCLRGHLNLDRELGTNAAIKIHSSAVNLSRPDRYDNTEIRFMNGDDMLFRFGVRRRDRHITFNSHLNGHWGDRIDKPLEGVFVKQDTTFVVYDQGDSFEVTVDGQNVCNFPRRSPKNVQYLLYGLWDSRANSALADKLSVQHYVDTTWEEVLA